MKKIQREVTTYKDIYVSVDGKEFNNETDCKEWENSYKGTLAASWKLVKKISVNAAYIGLPYSNDDDECYVIKPQDLNEITLINAYIQSSTYNNGTTLTANHIGELVALNFGYDHDYCMVYALSDHMKNITDHITETEKEMQNL